VTKGAEAEDDDSKVGKLRLVARSGQLEQPEVVCGHHGTSFTTRCRTANGSWHRTAKSSLAASACRNLDDALPTVVTPE